MSVVSALVQTGSKVGYSVSPIKNWERNYQNWPEYVKGNVPNMNAKRNFYHYQIKFETSLKKDLLHYVLLIKFRGDLSIYVNGNDVYNATYPIGNSEIRKLRINILPYFIKLGNNVLSFKSYVNVDEETEDPFKVEISEKNSIIECEEVIMEKIEYNENRYKISFNEAVGFNKIVSSGSQDIKIYNLENEIINHKKGILNNFKVYKEIIIETLNRNISVQSCKINRCESDSKIPESYEKTVIETGSEMLLCNSDGEWDVQPIYKEINLRQARMIEFALVAEALTGEIEEFICYNNGVIFYEGSGNLNGNHEALEGTFEVILKGSGLITVMMFLQLNFTLVSFVNSLTFKDQLVLKYDTKDYALDVIVFPKRFFYANTRNVMLPYINTNIDNQITILDEIEGIEISQYGHFILEFNHSLHESLTINYLSLSGEYKNTTFELDVRDCPEYTVPFTLDYFLIREYTA